MNMTRTCQRFLLFTLIFPAASPAARGQTKSPGSKAVALVNGEPIGRADFEAAFARVSVSQTGFSDTQRKALQREILGMMIDELLFYQVLKKNIPAPNSALVERRLGDLQASLRAKGRTLQEYCEDTGQSEARLRADIAAVIQWNAYINKRAIDSELKGYYEEYREVFDGVLIRVSHIALQTPAPDDSKAKQAAIQKLQTIRKELLSGLDFAEAAKKYSQVPTAAQGGDLGYFPPRGPDSDPFLRALTKLKVGQISDVVTTDYGYHLIKITERKEGKPTTFEEVRDEVRLLWSDELRLNIIAEQRRSAKIEVDLP